MLSAESIGEQREDLAKTDNNLVQVIVCTFNSLLFSVSSTSITQLLNMYMLQLCYFEKERESGSKHIRNCVYLSNIKEFIA